MARADEWTRPPEAGGLIHTAFFVVYLAARHGLLDVQGVVALRWLYGSRVKADYTDEAVDFEDANKAVEKAKLLVERLLS